MKSQTSEDCVGLEIDDLIFEDQRVDDRAHDDERDERRQKGAQPQIADQQAVHEPDQRAGQRARAR